MPPLKAQEWTFWTDMFYCTVLCQEFSTSHPDFQLNMNRGHYSLLTYQKSLVAMHPRKFCKHKLENHKKFFDWMSVQRGHNTMDDWYDVTTEDICNCGGGSLMQTYYNDSTTKALKSIYPEHKWMLWRFKNSPNGFWSTSIARRCATESHCGLVGWTAGH